jgi:hypothetical protein
MKVLIGCPTGELSQSRALFVITIINNNQYSQPE